MAVFEQTIPWNSNLPFIHDGVGRSEDRNDCNSVVILTRSPPRYCGHRLQSIFLCDTSHTQNFYWVANVTNTPLASCTIPHRSVPEPFRPILGLRAWSRLGLLLQSCRTVPRMDSHAHTPQGTCRTHSELTSQNIARYPGSRPYSGSGLRGLCLPAPASASASRESRIWPVLTGDGRPSPCPVRIASTDRLV